MAFESLLVGSRWSADARDAKQPACRAQGSEIARAVPDVTAGFRHRDGFRHPGRPAMRIS